ncbi:MAG: diphthine synthase [Candidatus Woesearchaeota archaeon]|nr:diphthine synthase [Candidatus Woesearchaeota archaeon]
MALYLIGLGLGDERDITLKGLEFAKKSDYVYLERYTAILPAGKEKLEKLIGKKILDAERIDMEQGSSELIEKAKNSDVSVLVVGDPLSATTHAEIMREAEEKGVKAFVVNNASILNAIGSVGLQLYKFGKTTSIPFPEEGFTPETPYDVLAENLSIGAHTLILLDLRPKEGKFMTANDGIKYMLDIEGRRKKGIFTEKTLCIGCARMGSDDSTIKSGTAKQLLAEDFGKPLHCIIIPGKLHFVEEDCIKRWRV